MLKFGLPGALHVLPRNEKTTSRARNQDHALTRAAHSFKNLVARLDVPSRASSTGQPI